MKIKIGILALALFMSGSLATAWAQAFGQPPGFERARAALAAHINDVLAVDGVGGMGVGVGAGGEAELVITANRPGITGLPRRLGGVNVRVLVTGPFFANPKPQCPGHPSCKDGNDSGGEDVDPTAEFPEPVPIGVSVGNQASCSAGTFGARASTAGGDVVLLSNNHVLAEENDADRGSPSADDTDSDTIHQPGRYDTNCVASGQKIGVLSNYVPLDFTGDNYVDAAIALNDSDPTPPGLGHAVLDNTTPGDGYGMPSSCPADSTLGMLVQKYGRTTGQTNGEIVIDPWEGNVGYSAGTAHFVDQIVVYRAKGGPFLKSGDSGSLVVTDDDNKNPVGLLFAGNSSGKYGIANKIGHVLDELGITIDGSNAGC
ncbi:MAG: hypothetical protein R3229_14415 [Alphaproteobacteria bacterium]|nr:hypothetical protein [Alphaproteobacteria bacterium]